MYRIRTSVDWVILMLIIVALALGYGMHHEYWPVRGAITMVLVLDIVMFWIAARLIEHDPMPKGYETLKSVSIGIVILEVVAILIVLWVMSQLMTHDEAEYVPWLVFAGGLYVSFAWSFLYRSGLLPISNWFKLDS